MGGDNTKETWNKKLKYEKDVIKLALYYIENEMNGEDFITRELMQFIQNNDLIVNAPFFLSLDNKGRKLGHILNQSDRLMGKRKYSKKFKVYGIHYNKKKLI